VTFTDSISDPIPWYLYLRLIPTVRGSDGDESNNLRSFIHPLTFDDVATSHQFYQEIETLYANGVTSGCDENPMLYCPSNSTLRSQMAVFLVRAKHGSVFEPPAAEGIFDDVPPDWFFAPYNEHLHPMTPLKKGQPREEDWHMWGCGRSPLPHICSSPLLEGSFFSVLMP